METDVGFLVLLLVELFFPVAFKGNEKINTTLIRLK